MKEENLFLKIIGFSISTLTKRMIIGVSCMTLTLGAEMAPRDEEHFSGINRVSTEVVGRIKEDLEEFRPLIDSSVNKDIIFCLGNAGSGKSTTVNILAGRPLEVTSFNEIVPVDAQFPEELLIKGIRCLSLPQVGVVYDMPGFPSSVSESLVNAALIHAITMRAKTVKVILTLSESELDATRGKYFLEALRHVHMFPGNFLETSLSLILTKVSTDVFGDYCNWLVYITSPSPDKRAEQLLNMLIDSQRVGAIPTPKTYDKTVSSWSRICSWGKPITKFQAETKKHLEEKISQLSSLKPESINLSVTFNSEVSSDMKSYFNREIQAVLEKEKETWGYKFSKNSTEFEQSKQAVQRHFVKALNREEAIQRLKPFCAAQYQYQLQRFLLEEGIFERMFKAHLQSLQLAELKKAAHP